MCPTYKERLWLTSYSTAGKSFSAPCSHRTKAVFCPILCWYELSVPWYNTVTLGSCICFDARLLTIHKCQYRNCVCYLDLVVSFKRDVCTKNGRKVFRSKRAANVSDEAVRFPTLLIARSFEKLCFACLANENRLEWTNTGRLKVWKVVPLFLRRPNEHQCRSQSKSRLK